MAVVLRRNKENVPDGGQLLIYLFILCSGYVFNILKDLYLLLEELKNAIISCWTVQILCEAYTTNMCNQSHGALSASSFGLQQLEKIELFCFHGSLS